MAVEVLSCCANGFCTQPTRSTKVSEDSPNRGKLSLGCTDMYSPFVRSILYDKSRYYCLSLFALMYYQSVWIDKSQEPYVLRRRLARTSLDLTSLSLRVATLGTKLGTLGCLPAPTSTVQD